MPAAPASLQLSTAADLLEQCRLAGGDPDGLIMVGGSAGLHWITAVADGDDPAAAETPLGTRDIEFQFDRTENDPELTATIEMFANAIGGRVTWPGIDHATPEIAHVLVPDYFGPDEPLIVDFLVDVVGIPRERSQSRLESLMWKHPTGTTSISGLRIRSTFFWVSSRTNCGSRSVGTMRRCGVSIGYCR